MNSFSISQLEQFSGVKAHTIRTWEQRYNALRPDRSEGNTRYYNHTELKRLLNIVSLMGDNYRISELSSLSNAALAKLLEDRIQKGVPLDEAHNYYVSQLIAAGMQYNEAHFDKIFGNCILRMGMYHTYVNVIYPMLVRIGLMWSAELITPAYEHFISNLIRQKLFTAIDSLPPPSVADKRWLLFLPQNESHEIGLLFSHYLIKQSGQQVVYLGGNIPEDTLKEVAREVKPSHLLFFMVHHQSDEAITQYIHLLKKQFKNTNIFMAANESKIKTLRKEHKITFIQSVTDLSKQLSPIHV